MMENDFKEWLAFNKKFFLDLGITVDNFEDNIETPGVSIIHQTMSYMGQITVRDTGYVDIDILLIESEETVFHLHCFAKEGINFNLLLGNYIEYMKR